MCKNSDFINIVKNFEQNYRCVFEQAKVRILSYNSKCDLMLKTFKRKKRKIYILSYVTLVYEKREKAQAKWELSRFWLQIPILGRLNFVFRNIECLFIAFLSGQFKSRVFPSRVRDFFIIYFNGLLDGLIS